MNPRNGQLLVLPDGGAKAPGVAANDADPFDGVGAGDWGDQWIDQRLNRLFDTDTQAAPSPRLAELLRLLQGSLDRDRRD